MKRIIIWVLIGIFLILGSYVLYSILTTRKHSPFEEVTESVAGLETKVTYCRPFKKGRVIFGTKEESALQPWGQYWRMGANEATQISFSEDVEFGDQEVAAGTYVMYAIPSPNAWTIRLNSELGRWGYYEADHTQDVTEISVPVQSVGNTEQLTITLVPEDPQTKVMVAWDTYQVAIPVIPQSAAAIMAPAAVDSTEAAAAVEQ